MAAYRGLLMGCAKDYWMGVLEKLYQSFYQPQSNGMTSEYPFEWSSVFERHPEITKKDLTRLKSSEWILKAPRERKNKINKWLLADEALNVIKEYQRNNHF